MCTFDARDLTLELDEKTLKPLFKLNSAKHGRAIFYNWVIIFGMMILWAQFPSAWLYVVAILVIGARMHALAILMHDAAHYRFLKNRKWNDRLTNWLTMYTVFTSIEKYRGNHLAHHQHLNTEEDPDWVAKLGKRAFTFPKTKQEFLITVLSYFTLYQGISDAIWFAKRFGRKKGQKKTSNDRPMFVFLVLLVAVLSFFSLWKYYLLLWIVPYLSTFFMFQYIRSVAEHFGALSYDDLLSSTRTVKTSFIERFFLAPHNVGFHLEHHLFPGVPFYNLPKLHRLLMQQKDYADKAHVTDSYTFGLLAELA